MQSYPSSQIGSICELFGTKATTGFSVTGVAFSQSGDVAVTSLITGSKVSWESKGKINKSLYPELEFDNE